MKKGMFAAIGLLAVLALSALLLIDRPASTTLAGAAGWQNPTFQYGTVSFTVDEGPFALRSAFDRDKRWLYVAFPHEFSAPPTVVMGPPTINGVEAGVMRIKDVDHRGFYYQFDEWDYLDGHHGAEERVSWFAALPGEYHDGKIRVMEREIVDHEWHTIVYGNEFDGFWDEPPLLFTQVVTFNGTSAVTVRVRPYITEHIQAFQVRLQEEEGNDDTHAQERVHIIMFANTAHEDIRGGNPITVGTYPISDTVTAPDINFDNNNIILANLQTFNGADPATLRVSPDESNGGTVFHLQEEQSRDGETTHDNEELMAVLEIEVP